MIGHIVGDLYKKIVILKSRLTGFTRREAIPYNEAIMVIDPEEWEVVEEMGSLDLESKNSEDVPVIDNFVPPENAVDVSPKNDRGVLKVITKEGSGEATPPKGCKVIVHYEGKLTDGTVFDSSKERTPFEFDLGKGTVIKAWDIGVATMKKGEVCLLYCREDYAYGASGSPPKIPPKATLIFEVEMIDWEPENLSGKKDKGILRIPITEGVGFDSPKEFGTVDIHLKGEHEGRVFDERDVSFCLGEGADINIPPGVEKALEKFIKGETSKLEIKPQYGFGSAGHEGLGIPPNAKLTYTVTLKTFDQIEDSWMMTSAQKITESKKMKEKGTNYFKAEKFQLALKMYNRMVTLLDFKSGFENEEKQEADSLLLAANLNVSLCQLKLKNFTEARNVCDKVLEIDDKNVKALFRRGQAYLGLGEPQLAKIDFESVIKIEPENKAAPAQIAVCNQKLKEIREKEKKMYSNMFEKFAQKDREWRFGWLDGDKPQVEIAPENPEILEARKNKLEAKRRYLQETKRLLEEKKAKEEKQKMEEQNKDKMEQDIKEVSTDENENTGVNIDEESSENLEKVSSGQTSNLPPSTNIETCKYNRHIQAC